MLWICVSKTGGIFNARHPISQGIPVYDFFNICREVVTDWMICCWIDSGGDFNSPDAEIHFQAWMHDEDTIADKHFSAIVFLLDTVFPAYSIYTKGIRRNMQPVYNGGHKMILPFLGPLGNYPQR